MKGFKKQLKESNKLMGFRDSVAFNRLRFLKHENKEYVY